MRIGVDVDNTMNNFSQSVAKYLDPIIGKDSERLLQQTLHIHEAAGWEDEDTVDFFLRYGKRIHMEAPAKDKYLLATIKGLFLRGFDISVITNRQNERVGFDVETQTSEWLDAHKLTPYIDDVHFVKDCKHEYATVHKLGVGLMIEDNLERAIPFLENGIPVILFNHGYNHTHNGQLFVHKHLHRVNNWWEVYQKAIDIEKELFNSAWQRSYS